MSICFDLKTVISNLVFAHIFYSDVVSELPFGTFIFAVRVGGLGCVDNVRSCMLTCLYSGVSSYYTST